MSKQSSTGKRKKDNKIGEREQALTMSSSPASSAPSSRLWMDETALKSSGGRGRFLETRLRAQISALAFSTTSPSQPSSPPPPPAPSSRAGGGGPATAAGELLSCPAMAGRPPTSESYFSKK